MAGRGEEVSWLEWLEDRPMAICHRLDHAGFEWMMDDLSDEVDISEEESEDFDDRNVMGTIIGLVVVTSSRCWIV